MGLFSRRGELTALIVLLHCASCGRVGYDLIEVVQFSSPLDASAPVAIGPARVDSGTPAPVVRDDAGCAACFDARPPCLDTAEYPGGGIFKSDFSDVSDMTLTGEAFVNGDELRLMPAMDARGAAYFTTPIPFGPTSSVYVHFAFRIGGGAGENGGDGFTWILQSSPMGPLIEGTGGGSLGYGGISPSVVVEFDSYENPPGDPATDHVAVVTNGTNAEHLVYATPPFLLNDGAIHYVWIDYDASRPLLEVYVSNTTQRPDVPMLAYGGLNFSEILDPEVYLGFTAAGGTAQNEHDILGEAWFVVTDEVKCR